MLRRAVSLGLVIAATLALAGCFVASIHVPKGAGPIADRRLVGSWQGIDDGDHNPTTDDVVLTFRMTTNAKPLRLTWSEGDKRLFYDVYTRKFGAHRGFAAKLTGPADAQRQDETMVVDSRSLFGVGAHYLVFLSLFCLILFLRLANPSRISCGTRLMARASAGTSPVIVDPAATSAPRPILTGATS